MLSFTHPLALIALTAILIPLLIHLWERRRARVVRVGSVRWLAESSDARVSRLRFSEFWRFLLRASLVALAGILLADPAWETPTEMPQGTWIVLDAEAARHPQLVSQWDSLIQAGQPVKVLAPNFSDWKAGEPVDSVAYPPWLMLQKLAYSGQHPDSVVVFSAGGLAGWKGPRPALPFPVRWNFLPPPDPAHILLAAWRQGEQVRWFAAESGSEALQVKSGFLPLREGTYPAGQGLPAIQLEVRLRPSPVGVDSLWSIFWQKDPASPLPVAERPERGVVLVVDEGEEEGEVALSLQAALSAVGEYLNLPVATRVVTIRGAEQTNLQGAGADTVETWLCWLSATDLPPGLVSRFQLRVLRVEDSSATGPVHMELSDKGWVLRGDLLRRTDDALPAVLLTMLFGEEVLIRSGQDNRQIDVRQAETRLAGGQAPRPDRPWTRQKLFFPLWLLLLGLFLLERFWAARIWKQRTV